MRESGERGELDVYFGDKLDADVQAAFQQFVHDHLMAKAKDVERLRNYFCPKPKCGKEALDRVPIDAARATKRKGAKVFCAHCGAGILVDDVLEQQFISKEGERTADEAGRKASQGITTASMEGRMVGIVQQIVFEADQIYRTVTQPDVGVDGEIQFRKRNKKAVAHSFRVQLKAGDSHLRTLKDGTEKFGMEDHYEELWGCEDAPPVLLIILTSDGRIRYMNATKAIHAAQKKSPGNPVKQLAFVGEDFTKEAVLKLRDERLK